MHCQIDEIICNIEPRGAGIADMIEICLTARKGSRVDRFAICKQYQLVEKRNNVRSWLVNCEDDRSVVSLRQRDQALNDIESIEGVETTSRLVEKEDARTRN